MVIRSSNGDLEHKDKITEMQDVGAVPLRSKSTSVRCKNGQILKLTTERPSKEDIP